MAQITKFVFLPKFLKIVEIAEVWKLHIKKIPVTKETEKVTKTKEVVEMVDMPYITKMVITKLIFTFNFNLVER